MHRSVELEVNLICHSGISIFNNNQFLKGIIAAGAHGILRSINCNPNLRGDIVPVDVVANLGTNSIGTLDSGCTIFSLKLLYFSL